MNLESVLEFSLINWLKRQESLKYILLIWGISFLFLGLVILLAFALFGELILAMFKDATAITAFANPTAVSELLTSVFLFVPFLLLLGLTFALISGYITVLIQLYAFRCKNIPYSEFSVTKYIRLIILFIVVFLATMFWPFNSKIRIVQWILLLCMFLGLIFILIIPFLSIILFLATIPYLFVILYNSIRFSMCSLIFLHKEVEIFSTLRESWTLTRGKVIDIFAAFIVVGIIFAIAILIVSTILQTIFAVIMIAIVGNPDLSFAIYYIAQTPAEIITSPIHYLVYAFLFIAIYSELISQKTPVTKPSPVKKRTLPTKPETIPMTPRKKPAKKKTVSKTKNK